jgi:magnesium transporter
LPATPPGSSAPPADAAVTAAAAAPPPLRVFHLQGDRVAELPGPPEALPPAGFLWIACPRRLLEVSIGELQAMLERWTGAALFEPHVSDLLNRQLPSNFDSTSDYDLLVFRRLAAAPGSEKLFGTGDATGTQEALQTIDTSAVGFAVFDRVLLTVHPGDCQVRDSFAERLKAQASALAAGNGGATTAEGRPLSRLPASPADLMVRMVNHIVDGYLELRRLLSKQIDFLEEALFDPRSAFHHWRALLATRKTLHLLEDISEDQRDAVVEWIDVLDAWPEAHDPARQRSHEQLRVRSRDVLEHIERVLSHVRRLQSQAETAVQMHYSEQSNRTNDIMRTMTTLTAVFLPLNLVTGFFGMNFEGLPLVHSPRGFWVVFSLILLLGVGGSVYFWRRRYIGRL